MHSGATVAEALRLADDGLNNCLLGLYLGDGCISRHPRGVFRLRIALDAKYPGIVEECAAAMQAVVPWNKVHAQDVAKLDEFVGPKR